MRLANLDGRLTLVTADGPVDVATVSVGRFGPEPQSVFAEWLAFVDWCAASYPPTPARSAANPSPELSGLTDPTRLGPPVPAPSQIFAAGLNYGERARAAGEETPAMPPIFPKFTTCLTGPCASVVVPPEARLDHEVELVVVMGVRAYQTTAAEAWSHVAGLMIGQDLSDREAQFRPPVPQFGLSKSRSGFGPTGPFLVTTDELRDPDDLSISCSVNGAARQSDRTANMLLSVPELIERLSALLPLLPGDLIFTGTPGGVGHYETPPRYLLPGDVLTSEIEGLGRQRIKLIAPG